MYTAIVATICMKGKWTFLYRFIPFQFAQATPGSRNQPGASLSHIWVHSPHWIMG